MTVTLSNHSRSPSNQGITDHT